MADGEPQGIPLIRIILVLSSLFFFMLSIHACPPLPVRIKVDTYGDIILSPGYNVGLHYPPNTVCRWILEAPDDHVIHIQSEVFSVEGRGNCDQYDSLRILDGHYNWSRLLKAYCGKNQKINIKTTGEDAYLIFRSDHLVEDVGFNLSVKAVPEDEEDDHKKKPNLKAIIGGIGGGVVCSILFVTFACCCLSTRRCPCRQTNRNQRTVTPSVRRINVGPVQPSEHSGRSHRRNPSSVSVISTRAFENLAMSPRRPPLSGHEDVELGALSPPPYIFGPPPPLETNSVPSSASNSSASPPPPYSEQDPHPNAVPSDSVPSYSSR